MGTKKSDNNVAAEENNAAVQPEKETRGSDADLLQASAAFEKRFAAEIQARMSAGLSYQDALDVQRAQVAADTAGK